MTETYTSLSLSIQDEEVKEIIIALLSAEGFEGFEETEQGLVAYIPSFLFPKQIVTQITDQFSVQATVQEIEAQNWNKLWESNFQPVKMDKFCMLRADFHEPDPEVQYDIVVTPKMSFGTGHHATTRLMISFLQKLELSGKNILDLGTGTGVLAILSYKMGAGKVTAVDIDPWSYENAQENFTKNNSSIQLYLGGIEQVSHQTYDVVLANINLHILLAYMESMYTLTHAGGMLILSGILHSDRDTIVAAAEEVGFRLKQSQIEGEWMAVSFQK